VCRDGNKDNNNDRKIPGTPKINKLRVIHLYKADYNLLLKIIWARRLVWHAHDAGRINKGQAGSRPDRCCNTKGNEIFL
jgi:hypothetical protein